MIAKLQCALFPHSRRRPQHAETGACVFVCVKGSSCAAAARTRTCAHTRGAPCAHTQRERSSSSSSGKTPERKAVPTHHVRAPSRHRVGEREQSAKHTAATAAAGGWCRRLPRLCFEGWGAATPASPAAAAARIRDLLNWGGIGGGRGGEHDGYTRSKRQKTKARPKRPNVRAACVFLGGARARARRSTPASQPSAGGPHWHTAWAEGRCWSVHARNALHNTRADS